VKVRFARFLSSSLTLAIVLPSLYSVAGEESARPVPFPNQSQAPAFAGAWASPSYILPLFSPAPAIEDTLDRALFLHAESPLPPPVSEELFSCTDPVPPVSTDENSVPTLAALQEGQKALQATVEQQGTQIAGLQTLQLQQGQELSQLGNDVAMLKSDQMHLTNTIAAIRNDAAKRQAHVSFAQTVALASGGVLALSVLGIVIVRLAGSRPPAPLPTLKTPCRKTTPVAPVDTGVACGLPDIHMALHYLSTPKHEDRIAAASCPGLHVLVVADGASSCQGEGTAVSGGGGEAAAIAVMVAITHLTEHLHPALGITALLESLFDCFASVNTSIEHHNEAASIPGATTLLFAALWQADSGMWYWLYGNIGDGVLTLLHTTQLLSGWPLSTPLLSKQSNGTTTITLPGYAAAGIAPSIGIAPHVPGDMLLIGSDGLDHLDTVTKHTDRLTLANYLWTRIRSDRSHLLTHVKALPEGRTDAPWQTALTLDDTTIGILWS
jgi:hypothetical protein